ncbi:hypothetical protein [Vibrio mediterranei]|uniref:hypothetical protein n=1 Tax=Vibrio mediterranei TaxID=689 RepID=UPI0040676AD9
MLKFLFLTPEFPPCKLTGAIRPSRFAKYISRKKHSVTVLTFEHEDSTNSRLLEDIEGVRIEHCGRAKKILVNDLGVSYLIQAFRKTNELVEEINPDYVLVSMPTFINSILALYLHKRYGVKYILDYRDLWVADPYPVRGIKSKIFRNVSKIIEPLILRSSYLSCYVSDAMYRDQVKCYPFLAKLKTEIISTGFDAELVNRIVPSREKNGYISHIGNADGDMNLSEFVSILRDDNVKDVLLERNLKFLFVGRKNDLLIEEIVKVDRELLNYIDFRDYLPHNEALQLMADSSGLLILGSNSEQRLNRKVFEYTSLNSNVFYLGNVHSPTAKIVTESSGYVSSHISAIPKMEEFLATLSDRAVAINLDYSKENLVNKLLDKL